MLQCALRKLTTVCARGLCCELREHTQNVLHGRLTSLSSHTWRVHSYTFYGNYYLFFFLFIFIALLLLRAGFSMLLSAYTNTNIHASIMFAMFNDSSLCPFAIYSIELMLSLSHKHTFHIRQITGLTLAVAVVRLFSSCCFHSQ